jgi:hypothetical protein
MLAATGGRRGEVAGLQWQDIDFVTGLCKIERAVKQISGQPLIVGDAKNHQKRVVQLDPTTIGVLVDHQGRMTERAEFCQATLTDRRGTVHGGRAPRPSGSVHDPQVVRPRHAAGRRTSGDVGGWRVGAPSDELNKGRLSHLYLDPTLRRAPQAAGPTLLLRAEGGWRARHRSPAASNSASQTVVSSRLWAH